MSRDVTFESLMEGSSSSSSRATKDAKAVRSRRRKRIDDASQGAEKATVCDRFTISFVSDAVVSDTRASAVSNTEIRSFFQESGAAVIADAITTPETDTNMVVDTSCQSDDNTTQPRGRLPRTTCRDVVLAAVPEFDDAASSSGAFDNYRGACWWDAHAFSTPCISIPGTYDTKSKQFVQWHGAFCSWECALAYAHHTNRHRSVPMLWQLRQKVTGNLYGMQHALHFSELAHFGGARTIDDFRRATTLTEK